MDLSHLHFAHPFWLWAASAIPLVWIAFFLFKALDRPHSQLEKYIDSHLLPYLLLDQTRTKNSIWKAISIWSFAWMFLTVALAGPRWNFREIDSFSLDQSLVMMLDLSESMNASDVKPSRLVRAKQKIEDLLNLSDGVKVGLIAFAADPHMIAPITEDKEMIRHLLPSLDTDLVYVQGSRLSSALDMASSMLEAEPGSNKALLIISDGGFEDPSAITTAKKIAEKGVAIHAMGVGTPSGEPLKDQEGNMIKKNGKLLISKLEKEKLSELSKIGKGRYLEAHYSDHDETLILKELKNRAEVAMNKGKKNRIWDEHFYLFLLPLIPVMLYWFRRGYLFAPVFVLSMLSLELQAVEMRDYLMNSEELGKEACDCGDYEAAVDMFQDPYRKGVAHYKAGDFLEAEKMFRRSSREEVAASAGYNIGNCLVQQQKLKEAVTAYEEVLKDYPEHTKAKENLELVKKMLEEQNQNSSDSDKSEKKDEKDQDRNDSEDSDDNDQQESKDSESGDENDQNQQQNEESDKPDEQKDEDQSQEGDQDPPKEDNQESDDLNENEGEAEEEDTDQEEDKNSQMNPMKSQDDQDADQWLNQITNDPKQFLKNKFTIESKKNGTKGSIDPW